MAESEGNEGRDSTGARSSRRVPAPRSRRVSRVARPNGRCRSAYDQSGPSRDARRVGPPRQGRARNRHRAAEGPQGRLGSRARTPLRRLRRREESRLTWTSTGPTSPAPASTASTSCSRRASTSSSNTRRPVSGATSCLTRDVSRQTGMHIVCASGIYRSSVGIPPQFRGHDADELAGHFVRELTLGVEGPASAPASSRSQSTTMGPSRRTRPCLARRRASRRKTGAPSVSTPRSSRNEDRPRHPRERELRPPPLRLGPRRSTAARSTTTRRWRAVARPSRSTRSPSVECPATTPCSIWSSR